MKTTVVKARVNRQHASQARAILARIGLRPSDAISALMAQVVAHRGIPFPLQEEGYSYAASEYGLTPGQMDAAEARIRKKIERERRRGRLLKRLT